MEIGRNLEDFGCAQGVAKMQQWHGKWYVIIRHQVEEEMIV